MSSLLDRMIDEACASGLTPTPDPCPFCERPYPEKGVCCERWTRLVCLTCGCSVIVERVPSFHGAAEVETTCPDCAADGADPSVAAAHASGDCVRNCPHCSRRAR